MWFHLNDGAPKEKFQFFDCSSKVRRHELFYNRRVLLDSSTIESDAESLMQQMWWSIFILQWRWKHIISYRIIANDVCSLFTPCRVFNKLLKKRFWCNNECDNMQWTVLCARKFFSSNRNYEEDTHKAKQGKVKKRLLRISSSYGKCWNLIGEMNS